MPCANCDGPALEELCTYCSGQRPRAPETVITGEQWAEYLRAAAARARELLAVDGAGKPGPQALAHLLAAYILIESSPGLPSFEWYAAQVQAAAHMGKALRPR